MTRVCRLSRTRPPWRRLRPLLLVGAVLVLAGCSTTVDFERARRVFRRSPPPELPQLVPGPPTANLPGPERLRATSGELRKVPLQWDPILVGDVGGFQIERADRPEGPFEPVTAVAGALTTTWIDRLAPDAPTPTAEAAPAAAGAAENDAAAGEAAPPDPPGETPEPAAAAEARAAAPETDAAPTPEPASDAPPVLDEAALLAPAAPPERSRGPDGRTLYYRVRAFTPSGELAVAASDVVAATTALLPAAPEELRAYSHQPRRVPLSWRASRDFTVAGYRVFRSPTFLGPFEVVADLVGRHDTTYTDANLGDLRVFYYQVAAVNADGGEGVHTEPVRAVTKPEPLPPMGLRVIGKGLGKNQLAWEPNVEPDIAEYRVLRLREEAAEPELFATVSHGSFSALDDAVGAGEKVRYFLVAFDQDGLESAPGEPIEVTSEAYGLGAAATTEGVVLTWNPRTQEGFRGAQVLRGGIFDQREFPRVSGGRFVDSDVKPGRSYRYSVALVGADGRLAPRSATVEVEVPRAD